MDLNLPVSDKLMDCENLLIAGMGGGFDIFCGLPIYFALKEKGVNVHLANYSFSDVTYVAEKGYGTVLTDTLVGVTADVAGTYVYFPELYLSQWFKETRDEDVTIWSFIRQVYVHYWKIIRCWLSIFLLTVSYSLMVG